MFYVYMLISVSEPSRATRAKAARQSFSDGGQLNRSLASAGLRHANPQRLLSNVLRVHAHQCLGAFASDASEGCPPELQRRRAAESVARFGWLTPRQSPKALEQCSTCTCSSVSRSLRERRERRLPARASATAGC